MPRPTADNDLRLRKVDGLLGFFEDFLRLVANDAVGNFYRNRFDRSRARPASALSPRKAPFWNVTNHGASLVKLTSAANLPWNIWRVKTSFAFLVLEADAVADDGASHGRRELGNEVAHLVGMRHQHQLRLFRCR